MTEVPTSEWMADFDQGRGLACAPRFPSKKPRRAIAWRRIPGVVRHIFTHFPLELTVYAAELPLRSVSPAGMRWVGLEHLGDEALPSVMRKVVAHALARRPCMQLEQFKRN
jgi:A/G-specific adenine glycosylase